eukprot:Gb_02394 [translate_table: standard]
MPGQFRTLRTAPFSNGIPFNFDSSSSVHSHVVCSFVLPWRMASSYLVGWPTTCRCDGLNGEWWIFSLQTLYPLWRPIELAAVAAGNPDRPVDGINTIRMLLTSAKANTAASYPSVSTEDEGRDPDYISLACLGTRQTFRCGGVLDDISLSLMYKEFRTLEIAPFSNGIPVSFCDPIPVMIS